MQKKQVLAGQNFQKTWSDKITVVEFTLKNALSQHNMQSKWTVLRLTSHKNL